MKSLHVVVLLFLGINSGIAQIPQVPSVLYLGEQKLILNAEAKREIQKHVDALHSNQHYFEKKANLAASYFPLVGEVLKNEGVPNEFKYLAVQESGFVSDAVSKSNAVGYWQFKKETAEEFGLKVNSQVDERMHIVYSTKAAARYLRKSYFFLQNWVLVCQSYQMGLGGTQRSTDPSKFGEDPAKIDGDTYWYVMKFLAHLVAFRPFIEKKAVPSIKLALYQADPHEEVNNILVNNKIDRETFMEYNKWLKGGSMNPFYKPYLFVVNRKQKAPAKKEPVEVVTVTTDHIKSNEFSEISSDLPYDPNTRIIYVVNKRKAILAEEGDAKITLAIRAGISRDELMEYNDLTKRDVIIPKKAYYLQKKRKKSPVAYHIFKEGESLWEISQNYAIRLASLRKMNRLAKGEKPIPGQVLWMKKPRPKGMAPEILDGYQKKEPEIIQKEEEIIKVEMDSSVFERDSLKSESNKLLEEEKVVEKEEPIAIEEKPTFQNHMVEKGETLYSISRKYNCTVEEIMASNGMNSSKLSIGQELKIPIQKGP